MKISLKWLNDYVDVSDALKDPTGLMEALTRVGLEVEGMENKAAELAHIVVGELVTVVKHPNADKLTLCDVNIGKEVKRIVCGATNHKQGDRVAVALEGAVLPGNFVIKKSKIRGENSEGMLCSLDELGLENKKQKGIWILPKTAPLGESLAKFQGLDDILLDINTTPNRADCLSHWGLAREVACIFDRPLKAPKKTFEKVGNEKENSLWR